MFFRRRRRRLLFLFLLLLTSPHHLLFMLFYFINWLTERAIIAVQIKSEQMRRVKRFPQWNQHINTNKHHVAVSLVFGYVRAWMRGSHRVLSIHIKISYFLASVLSSSVDLFAYRSSEFCVCVFFFLHLIQNGSSNSITIINKNNILNSVW